MTLAQIDPGIEIEQWRQEVWPLIKERGSATFEVFHRRKDGSLIPVEVTGNYMQFEGQEYLCAFARDISERKQAEEELRTFKALVENALDGVAMSTLDGRLDYLNPSFQAMAGPGTQMEGVYIPDLYPGEVRQYLEQEVIPAVMNEGAWQGVLEMRRPDGSRWLAQHSAFALRDEHGNIIKMANILRDVTEQKQAEAELRIFNSLVENAPDGVCVTDPVTYNITYANRTYHTLVQFGDELIGMHGSALLDIDDAQFQQIGEQVGINGYWQGVIPCRRKDGSTIATSQSLFMIYDEHGQVQALAVIARDITEQQRAEAERAALQQQVIDAQRDALRELSTPLIPISDNVVIMPLIGSIDSGRAHMVMETLLDGVAQHRSTLAILDITGVSVVDTQVAQALVSAAQAVKLLGAQVMLTGIQPPIAQTLVHLGVDLGGIITRGSLQSGIAAALRGSNEHRNGV
jgi:rsbT co-antagonist protein RsbR